MSIALPPDPPPPPAEDPIAALMASPEYQAQMAAMTQQAMASLQALVAALGQFPAPPPPKPEPVIVDVPAPVIIDIPAPIFIDVMPPDPPAPILSPEAQAQIAAMTQQAAASLRALVDALKQAGGWLPGPKTIPPLNDVPPPDDLPPFYVPPVDPIPPGLIDIPFGMPVDPVFIPWGEVPPAVGAGVKLLSTAGIPQPGPAAFGPGVFGLTQAPLAVEIATDMLAVLPHAPAAPEIAGPATPAAAASVDTTPPLFAPLLDHRAGGEGSLG